MNKKKFTVEFYSKEGGFIHSNTYYSECGGMDYPQFVVALAKRMDEGVIVTPDFIAQSSVIGFIKVKAADETN